MLSQPSFFEQHVKVTKRGDRVTYFKELIQGKSVLHIGCADWPIYNPAQNLHIQLCTTNPLVEGFDVNKEVIEQMKTHPNLIGKALYSTLPEKKYDLLLVPETIEHVNNVEGFLMGLTQCATPGKPILITAPNAFCANHMGRNHTMGTTFVEIVHPDHNCWYSPYTLANAIRKSYMANGVTVTFHDIGTVEHETMVYCLFSLS
jgi:2-polyprenyl-3-methyl-5-hydroxy-6-metoxy-1,4-benzoquinol methylase